MVDHLMQHFLAEIEGRAFRIAQIATGNREDALDIVQDAMIKLVQKYSTHAKDEWKPLFYSILQTRILDWHRRQNVRNRFRSWFHWDEDEETEDFLEQQPANNASAPDLQLQDDQFMDNLNTASVSYTHLDVYKRQVLERIIHMVCQPMQINNQEIIITCSVGIAVYPNDGAKAETLIQHADIAMYRAKELGKNNFQFFTESMNEKVAERMYVENLLRHALAKNELEVYYQPKVDLETMQMVGMEALIRWNSPELGFVSPIRFITLAEESGLIVPIGEWVMRSACQQTEAWQNAGYAPLLMSVNLSARQFKQSNLVERIQNILKETGLEAQYLELELTESMVTVSYTHLDVYKRQDESRPPTG